jgi:hypothetical protein
MLLTKEYNRENAVLYARRYAFLQNPLFFDFEAVGGNCTNFASQCIYAGSCVMNFTPIYGWYYLSESDRSASWSGVEFLYNFLISNTSIGPFGKEVAKEEVEIGDIIQLGRMGDFYHTLVVVGFQDNDILVGAQSDDALDRPLSSYNYEFLRYIKIEGVRINISLPSDCFDALYNGLSLGTKRPDAT